MSVRPCTVFAVWMIAALYGMGSFAAAQSSARRVEDALQNITNLIRTGRVGYATFWDGNKYVQCRRTAEREVRCEAAGSVMQPSLKNVLTPERLARLAELGWALDASFGNFIHTFPADTAENVIAQLILRTLTEAYGASADELEVQTSWVADVKCPQRNGPTQNLAGIVNDSPSMRRTAIYACSYSAPATSAQSVASASELVALYGRAVAAEIQRLRINARRNVYVVFDAGIGYVQCMPEKPAAAIYCEAQSAESWPALSSVLTPERITRLREKGYSDPGRAPNYWKSYEVEKFDDSAVADEVLTILYDVYGYSGATKLKMSTE